MARIADKTYLNHPDEIEQALSKARELVDAADLPDEWQPDAFVKVVELLMAANVMLDAPTASLAALPRMDVPRNGR